MATLFIADLHLCSEEPAITAGFLRFLAGVVQLSGHVESEKQSQRAESIAKAVDGVKSVKNDLKVKS